MTGKKRPPSIICTKDGLFIFDDKSDPPGPGAWICGPVEIVARSRTFDQDGWGVLVAFPDADGAQHRVNVPSALLAASGEEARKLLMSEGLEVSTRDFARRGLLEFLAMPETDRRCYVVDRLGWRGEQFILPDATISASECADEVLFTPDRPVEHSFRHAGTLDDWLSGVAALAEGNSRLQFAICAAFAAPLVALTGQESGGFHFVGPSSVGKSTALAVAGSVWGGGSSPYVRQWRATGNALESTAALHCDALLCLDELSQLSGAEAGPIAYMLANGKGKQRASRSGIARRTAEWRVLFLSSGETSIEDKIDEGRGRHHAGIGVRFVSIPADAGAGLGLLEELHGRTTPSELANEIKKGALNFYGQAARRFLQIVTEEYSETQRRAVDLVRVFADSVCVGNSEPQIARIASRFGLVAAAGELAIEFGLLPWHSGSAEAAVQKCFEDWQRERGARHSGELQISLQNLQKVIEQSGSSNFEPWNAKGSMPPGRDRYGWLVPLKGADEECTRRNHGFTSSAWNELVVAGQNKRTVNRLLGEAGILLVDGEGKTSQSLRPPSLGHSMRLYVVDTARLLDPEENV